MTVKYVQFLSTFIFRRPILIEYKIIILTNIIKAIHVFELPYKFSLSLNKFNIVGLSNDHVHIFLH